MERLRRDLPAAYQFEVLRRYYMHAVAFPDRHCGHDTTFTGEPRVGDLRDIWRLLYTFIGLVRHLRARDERSGCRKAYG